PLARLARSRRRAHPGRAASTPAAGNSTSAAAAGTHNEVTLDDRLGAVLEFHHMRDRHLFLQRGDVDCADDLLFPSDVHAASRLQNFTAFAENDELVTLFRSSLFADVQVDALVLHFDDVPERWIVRADLRGDLLHGVLKSVYK